MAPAFGLSSKERNKRKREKEALKREEEKKIEKLLQNSEIKRRRKRKRLSSESIGLDRVEAHNSMVDTLGLENATARRIDKTYTGTKIVGLATMHKSNLVPVLSPEHAKEIANMRRGEG